MLCSLFMKIYSLSLSLSSTSCIVVARRPWPCGLCRPVWLCLASSAGWAKCKEGIESWGLPIGELSEKWSDWRLENLVTQVKKDRLALVGKASRCCLVVVAVRLEINSPFQGQEPRAECP